MILSALFVSYFSKKESVKNISGNLIQVCKAELALADSNVMVAIHSSH